MSTNVENWKVTYDGDILGQVLSFMKSLNQTKVTSKALDGTIYIQTIGSPVKAATVSMFSSKEEMDRMNEAEADGAYINVAYRGVTYSGYIEGKPQWQAIHPGKWYNATITLLIEEETA